MNEKMNEKKRRTTNEQNAPTDSGDKFCRGNEMNFCGRHPRRRDMTFVGKQQEVRENML